MQDINMAVMTVHEVIDAVETATSIDSLRVLAKKMEVSFSGNTGMETLKTKLLARLTPLVESNPSNRNEFDEPDLSSGFDDDLDEIVVNKTPPKKAPKLGNLLKLDASTIEDVGLRRQVIRAQALRLVRVKIQNLDPNDATLSGGIISLQNKYTGKVAKYVPFGEESDNGYHIPWMMFEHLKQWKFPLRKEQKGGRFGVKTYKTVMVNKFNIEILPALTYAELKDLANYQRSAQTIDTAA